MNKIINKIDGTYYFDLQELYNRIRGFQVPGWIDHKVTSMGHGIIIIAWFSYFMFSFLHNNLYPLIIMLFQVCLFGIQILIEKRENVERYEFPWWTNRILVGVIGLLVILQFLTLLTKGL